MSWATLGSVQLDNPNSLRESNIVHGADTTTLNGTTRRAIRAIKKAWTFSYNYLSVSKYDEIYALVSAGDAVIFSIIDTSVVNIQNKTVFINMDAREFVAGNPSYLAGVTITLTEE